MKDLVVLAVIRRPRGIRGEVVAHSMGSDLERFTPGLAVTLVRGSETRPAQIERAWSNQDDLVLKLSGIDSRNEAEELRKLEVCVPESERPELPEGQFYLSDLIGCKLVRRDGTVVGEVSAWYEANGPALLEVDRNENFLVPFVDAICPEVDLPNKRITVELPEGLEELNK